MSDNRLSLDEFRRWMNTHEEKKFETERHLDHVVDDRVISNAPSEKILAKMELLDDSESEEEIAEDFMVNGGTIKDINDKQLLIETNCGSFYIHRCYVKKD